MRLSLVERGHDARGAAVLDSIRRQGREPSGVQKTLQYRPELFGRLVAAASSGDDAGADALQAEITEARAALRGRGIATLKHAVAELMSSLGARYREGVRAPLPQHHDPRGDR